MHLVDLAGAHGVFVEGAHRPADGAALLAELGVEFVLAGLLTFFVGEGFGLGGGELEGFFFGDFLSGLALLGVEVGGVLGAG